MIFHKMMTVILFYLSRNKPALNKWPGCWNNEWNHGLLNHVRLDSNVFVIIQRLVTSTWHGIDK